jgi:hypothetical protein
MWILCSCCVDIIWFYCSSLNLLKYFYFLAVLPDCATEDPVHHGSTLSRKWMAWEENQNGWRSHLALYMFFFTFNVGCHEVAHVTPILPALTHNTQYSTSLQGLLGLPRVRFLHLRQCMKADATWNAFTSIYNIRYALVALARLCVTDLAVFV